MELKYNRELYSRQSLLKAAYHFTDNYYVHLDCDTQYYLVSLTPKDAENGSGKTEEEFTNELLAQAVREAVFQQTQDIRKMVLGRAFASTIITDEKPVPESDTEDYDDELFEDWYESKDNIKTE